MSGYFDQGPSADGVLPVSSVSCDGSAVDASFGVSVGESPTVGAVPFWVTACLLFDPPPVAAANSVSTAVAVLMAAAVRVHGDLMVKLSPTRLALLCGYERPEKAKWITDYLQRIGFLRVMDGGVNASTGRRQARRDGAGRAIENEFVVFPSAPEHYRGPRSLAELDRWISADLDAAEQAPSRGGRRSGRSRSVSIRRRTLFAVPAGQPHTPAGGDGTGGLPPAGGDGGISAGQTLPPVEGGGCSALPPAGGDGGVCAGQALPPARGVLQIERSSISLEERDIEGSSAPARGSASPPAPARAAAASVAVLVEEPVAVEARELVRRLPWAAWAQARGRSEWRLSPADADQVQAAVTEAVTGHGLSWAEAAVIGQAALSEAKGAPVAYVVNAFTRHLARRRRALAAEPLSETPLPLLDPPAPRGGAQRRSQRPERAVQDQSAPAGAAEGSGSVPAEPSVPSSVLSSAACGTCEARDGDGVGMRTVTGDDGRCVPCPACRTGQSSSSVGA